MTKKILDFIEIKDTNGKKYLGGDQHWYKNKFHALSGCGPTVASEILAYLARENPKKCGGLYAFDIKNIDADDFVLHMDSVREYVKPGIKGLTSVSFFESSSKEFALNRGVKLYAKKTSSK